MNATLTRTATAVRHRADGLARRAEDTAVDLVGAAATGMAGAVDRARPALDRLPLGPARAAARRAPTPRRLVEVGFDLAERTLTRNRATAGRLVGALAPLTERPAAAPAAPATSATPATPDPAGRARAPRTPAATPRAAGTRRTPARRRPTA